MHEKYAPDVLVQRTDLLNLLFGEVEIRMIEILNEAGMRIGLGDDSNSALSSPSK